MKPVLKSKGRPALEILEQAVQLLREAGIGTALIYFTGALPFFLGLLFFLSDMIRNPFAQEKLVSESMIVAVLFVWKRIWQAIFAARLHERLSGVGFSPGNLPRLIAIQCALQPLRLIALPVSLLMTIPFGWVVAFFRGVGLFAALGDPAPIQSARGQSELWNRQNWGILSFITVAYLFLFLNVVVLVAMLPGLARSFLGIEEQFARIGILVLNTTTLAVVACVTWLAIDPVLEAAYVLRCFYGSSVESGEDLRASLRKAAAIAALVVSLFVFLPGVSQAQETPAPISSIDSARLDRAIDKVIRRREFTWRVPKTEAAESTHHWPGWVQSVFRSIRSGVDWLLEKLKKLFEQENRNQPDATKLTERPPIELWSAVLAVAVLAGGIILFLRRRRARPAEVTPVENSVVTVNLSDDSVTADQLPEASWLALADEWLTKGDYRLATRALYLAGLNYLGQRGLVSIRKSKTGLDYRRELERRARAAMGVSPEVVPVFQANNVLFERGWYGRYAVERSHVEAFASGLNEMRRFAGSK